MSELKYKIGDRVRIKSIDWYNENKDEVGNIRYKRDGSAYPVFFSKYMSNFCGEILTIKSVFKHSYHMNETSSCEFWTDEMIEGLVEEETKSKYEDEVTEEYYSTPKYLVRPNGYRFVDENGNVINARKIVLEKKKMEYPKTYEECCKILGCKADHFFTDFSYKGCDVEISDYEDKIDDLLRNFRKLRYCRDAYWKLYGDEMGLGKPWEPDFDNLSTNHEFIKINKGCFTYLSRAFVFPTPEMRDAFKKNFDPDIEICKELL